ncbi:hypothetical protein AAE478_002953 [Parahypoxylon ruwenzoriense]
MGLEGSVSKLVDIAIISMPIKYLSMCMSLIIIHVDSSHHDPDTHGLFTIRKDLRFVDARELSLEPETHKQTTIIVKWYPPPPDWDVFGQALRAERFGLQLTRVFTYFPVSCDAGSSLGPEDSARIRVRGV